MTKTFRLVYCGLVAGAVALFAVTQNAHATPINGGISFNGNVTAYLSAVGTGPVTFDYTLAHSVVFGASYVSAGANGIFSAIPANTPVTMYSPLLINPAQLPYPTSSPLWQVTGGGTTFSFTLSSLIESDLHTDSMELFGSGSMSDGNPADVIFGEWVATFTSLGSTFSWNSSASGSGSNTPVPDAGSTLLLLGLGLTALTAFVKFSKQAVA